MTVSHTITLEVSDEDFAALRRVAATTGQTPAEVILDRLRRYGPLESDEMRRRREVTEAAIDAAVAEVTRRTAARTGQTPEEVAREWRASLHAQLPARRTDDDERITLARLLPFRGAASSGDPHSADNDRIDADLAAEYAATHDEDS
jgi:hypothetical protein